MVVCEPFSDEVVTGSGIILGGRSKRITQYDDNYYTIALKVLVVGDDYKSDINVGDKILVNEVTPTNMTISGKEFAFVQGKEIIGVIICE